MPTYNVTAPNGVTYQVEGPPNAPQEHLAYAVYLKHPESAVAKEDKGPGVLDTATDFAKGLVRGTGSIIGGFGSELLTEAPKVVRETGAKGLAGLVRLTTGIPMDLTEKTVGALTNVPGVQKADADWARAVAPASQAIQRAGKAVETSVAPRVTPRLAEAEGFWQSFGSLAVTGAESAVPTLTALAVTAATKNPTLGSAIMGTLVVPQTYSGIRQEQKKQGIDDVGKALIGTAASSALDIFTGSGGAISRIGRQQATKLLEQGVLNAAKRAGKVGVSEFGTEGLQNVIEQVAGGADPLTKENMMQTLEAGLVGALMGTSVGVVSDRINQKRQEAARAAPALHTEQIMRTDPSGAEAAEAFDILTAPDKRGAVVVRDSMGNIKTVNIEDIEGMRAPSPDGAEAEPLNDILQRKAKERKEDYDFFQASQAAVKNPEDQDALGVIAERYIKMYGLQPEQAMQYAKASVANARAPQPSAAPDVAGAPPVDEQEEVARQRFYEQEIGTGSAAASDTQAAPAFSRAQAQKIISDIESGFLTEEEAEDRTGLAMGDIYATAEDSTLKYSRGRRPKDTDTADMFGALPVQEAPGEALKRDEFNAQRFAPAEQKAALQAQAAQEAEANQERAADRQRRETAAREETLGDIEFALRAQAPENAVYKVEYNPEDTASPYKLVAETQLGKKPEVVLQAPTLQDFSDQVYGRMMELTPFTPETAFAVDDIERVKPTEQEAPTAATRMTQDFVKEVDAAREAGQIDNNQRSQLLARLERPDAYRTLPNGRQVPNDAIAVLEAEALDAASIARNAPATEKKAAEAAAKEANQKLRAAVKNSLLNPARATLKSMVEMRQDEKAGAKQRVGGAKVQARLGEMEGADTKAEQNELRDAKIDLAEQRVSRYSRKQAAANLKAADVQAVVDKIAPSFKGIGNVVVVQSVSDITDRAVRRAIQRDGATDANGLVAPDGTVYLIADNLTSKENAKAVLFHEALGHVGLTKLFRDSLDRVLTSLYEGNAALRAQTDKWRQSNSGAYASDANPLARAVEEVLAERSEAGPMNRSFFQKLAAIVRDFARRIGFNLAISDGDVNAVLDMAHRQALYGEGNSPSLKDVRYTGLVTTLNYSRPKKGRAKAEEDIEEGTVDAQTSPTSEGILGGLSEAAKGHIAAAKSAPSSLLEAAATAIRPKDLEITRTDTIRDTIDRLSPTVGRAIKALDVIEQKVRAARAQMEKALTRRAREVTKFVNKSGQSVISNAMHTARTRRVDPTVANSLDELIAKDKVAKLYADKAADQALSRATRSAYKGHYKNRVEDLTVAWKAWEELGKQPGGHDMYKQLRQFYKDMYTAIRSELDENIRGSGIDADSAERLIRAAREDGDALTADGDRSPGVPEKLFPVEYFPFRRFGEYALLISADKGRERERHHFESIFERNQYEAKRARELGIKKGDEGYGAVFKTLDGLEDLKKSINADSAMLGEMKKIIDASALSGTFDTTKYKSQKEADIAAKEDLKDKLYQSYLMTLPERSIRKQFLHAELIKGNSPDILRIFKDSATQYASQLSKLAYGRDAQRAVETAYEGIESDDSGKAAKLRTLVNAYVGRYRDTMDPTGGPSSFEKYMSAFTFLQLMSSVVTAAVQPIAIPLQVLPRMGARYGWIKSIDMLDSYMPVMETARMFVDVDPATGEKRFNAPSLGNTNAVKKNPLRAELWRRLNDERDLFSQHLTHMLLRGGRTQRFGVKNATSQGLNMSGALMSSADQLSREITGMAFAELHYKKLRSEGVSPQEALDRTVEETIRNTNETLGNFGEFNKPGLLKGTPFRRMAGYLRTYSTERTSAYFRQWNAITKGSPYQTRMEAFNELAATVLLGAAAGGVRTIFGYSVAAGIINVLMKTLMSDEEKERRRREDPLAAFDIDYWFRNRYIPYHFGSDSMAARVAEHGLLSEVTGADLGPRISQNDLWVRNIREGDTPSATILNFLGDNFSPQVSYGLQLGDALDDIANGDIQRGLERVAPAFLRGSTIAKRLEAEGELQRKTGRVIMAPEEFTEDDLNIQRAGAVPRKLAEVRERNRAVIGWQRGMEKERTKIISDIKEMLRKPYTEEEAMREADRLRAYNAKVPFLPGTSIHDPKYYIEAKDIQQSITTSAKKAEKSVRGVEMTPAERQYLQ